jgi:hypothetical protein
MTVAELIAKLQAMPQDHIVLVVDDEYNEYDHCCDPRIVPVAELVMAQGFHPRFRDATDWDTRAVKGDYFPAVVLNIPE